VGRSEKLCRSSSHQILFVANSIFKLRTRAGDDCSGIAAPGNYLQTGSFVLITNAGGSTMPQGDKSKYTDKQERKADHIAESYEDRGVSEKEAERRAWATVNKDDGGGKKTGGSGQAKHTGHPAAHKGGEKGGKAAASRSAADRSASAKKAAATRKRNAEHAHH
jgi:plasmid stabilization system protein ParE